MGATEKQRVICKMVTWAVAIFIVLVSVTGCCSLCPKDPCNPITIQPTPPPAEAFVRPTLAITALKLESTDSEVIRAYVLSTDILINHSLYLEKLLSGYK